MAGGQPSILPLEYDHLDAAERAGVLAALLDERPELRAEVERLATALLQDVSADAVACAVASALEDLALEDPAGRVGRQPGRGFVHEGEAAYELAEEAVRPRIKDVRRRAQLGMQEAATRLALGVVAGLYRCRDAADGTVLAYAGLDTRSELADRMAHEAQVQLPPHEVEAACPDWAPLGW